VNPPRIVRLGDRGVTIELPDAAPEALWGLAEELQARIDQGRLPGAVEAMAALQSVTLFLDPEQRQAEGWLDQLRALAAAPPLRSAAGTEHVIPVCFDGDFAPDLPALCAARGIGADAFITAFLAAPVTARMLGFLPGFAYLGDLPAKLRAPRLASPRAQVPAGSVAVAGAFCAVYPWRSPGGWSLIGRTPIALFDATRGDRPALLAAGDRVRWQRIDRDIFESWRP
jgi:KipI family sensor histidine kinase inhibitor